MESIDDKNKTRNKINLISVDIADDNDNNKYQLDLLHKKVQILEKKLVNCLESQNQFYQFIGKVQILENKWVDWKYKYDLKFNQLQTVVSSLEKRLGLSSGEGEKENQTVNNEDPGSFDCYADNDDDPIWNDESEHIHEPGPTYPTSKMGTRSRSRTYIHDQDSSEGNIINLKTETSDNEDDDYFSEKRKKLINSTKPKPKHLKGGQETFPCKFCKDINLDSAEELAQHYTTQHKVPEKPKAKKSINSSKPKTRRPADFPCPDDCGKYFTSSRSVESHLIICRGLPKPFKCDQCDVEFLREKSKIEHMNNVHLRLSIALCPECGKSFTRERNLKTHILNLHSQRERSFNCTYCERSFYTLHDLQKHSKMHTEGLNFTCTVCGRSFRRQSTLNSHMFLHTGKPFSCKECGWKFTKKWFLVQHEYAHKLGKVKTLPDPVSGGRKQGSKRRRVNKESTSGLSKAKHEQPIPSLSSDSQGQELVEIMSTNNNNDFITPVEVILS